MNADEPIIVGDSLPDVGDVKTFDLSGPEFHCKVTESPPIVVFGLDGQERATLDAVFNRRVLTSRPN